MKNQDHLGYSYSLHDDKEQYLLAFPDTVGTPGVINLQSVA